MFFLFLLFDSLLALAFELSEEELLLSELDESESEDELEESLELDLLDEELLLRFLRFFRDFFFLSFGFFLFFSFLLFFLDSLGPP